jgi:cytochrome c553
MPGDEANRQAELAAEFERHENRKDGQQLVSSLESGLSVLRDLFYGRMHFDVEQIVGSDSMLIPLSESKTQRATQVQIELFQVIESAAAVQERRYVSSDEWYLNWLARFRLGDVAGKEKIVKEIAAYRGMKPDGRRLAFMDVLMRVLPESRKSPLVLFQLVPLAVQIATVAAFGDANTAAKLRQRQEAILPAIADCHACHGRVLDNGEICDVCSNPLWAYKWLTASD